MMKYQSVLSLLFLCIMTCFACKDKPSLQECVANFLAQSEMEAYIGQTWSDCRFFVHLYESGGGHYFMMDNYCMDMAAIPLDCNGERICELGSLEYCSILDNSTYVEIIGVGEL